MPISKQVVMVSAEIFPFAKVGGLADVLGALPKSLQQEGVEPVLFMPLYSSIQTEKFGIAKIPDMQIEVTIDGEKKTAELYSGFLPNTDIKTYFIHNSEYFDRDGIYTDPKTGIGYDDDGERFVFFCKVVPEAIKKLGLKPQIVHCNDSQTALVIVYLKKRYHRDAVLGQVKTVYSIHNLAYQGIYPPSILEVIGLGYEGFYPTGPFEFYGNVNFMKLGILYSDMITTVSPTYADEIQKKGYGLEGVLRARRSCLVGILNGVDYHIWNPESDPYLNIHYDAKNLSGKKELKKTLLDDMGISLSRLEMPLIGIVSRLVEQKGFDILIEAIPDFIKKDVSLVILGTGSKEIEKTLKELSEIYSDRMKIQFVFNPKMAHLIEAGSDMFLMPSLYEPCGLNQMYSLKYGTIPIVRKTGGLADTITDVKDNGVGFSFEKYDAKSLSIAVHRAIKAFKDKSAWQDIMVRAMNRDFSWKASAEKYVHLYDGLLIRPEKI